MSRIFIDRPIFAWVIAIIIMLAGIAGVSTLPVQQFPDIAPPQVNINTTYPGASAATLESSVTQVIEQQLTGLTGCSISPRRRVRRAGVDFGHLRKGHQPRHRPGAGPEQGAAGPLAPALGAAAGRARDEVEPRLPVGPLSRIPMTARPISTCPTLVSHCRSRSGAFGRGPNQRFWLAICDAHLARSQQAGRQSLMPADVITAITAQNAEVAAGEVGAVPSPAGQMLDATVTAQSRLTSPAIRPDRGQNATSGANVLLKDVARIELGAESYGVVSRVNGHPGAALAVSLSPGADALATAELVKAKFAELSKTFPAGYKYAFANDSTRFITKSVHDVVETLIEAIVLVVIVMFVFLQSWRATLIPAIAVPVVLLGTFGVFAFGYSINTLTLFGLVLAIGLLVDDAIVVVENVERLMAENPGMSRAMPPSIDEGNLGRAGRHCAGALRRVPADGFLWRVDGRDLSPVLADHRGGHGAFGDGGADPVARADDHLLKRPEDEDETSLVGRASHWMRVKFDKYFGKLLDWYHPAANMGRYPQAPSDDRLCVMLALLAFLFMRLPTGFLPTRIRALASSASSCPPAPPSSARSRPSWPSRNISSIRSPRTSTRC
jgi:multidrug efflux pump